MAYTYKRSYSAPTFDTPDGMLGLDQYAAARPGKNKLPAYWLRIPDNVKKQAEQGDYLYRSNDDKALIGKTLVNAIGTRFIDEFVDELGNIAYELGSQAKFDRLRTVPDEPPPTKAAVVVGLE